MAYSPSYLPDDDLLGLAEEFLTQFHPGRTIPTPIEQIVEFDFGMDIIPILGLRDEIGADAFLSSDLTSISVDEYVLKHVPVRYRFSLAHELGHHWLHDELYETTTIESVADWKRVHGEIGDSYGRFEFQANMFAGLVLVPPVKLKGEFEQKVRLALDAGLDRARLMQFPPRQRLIDSLARDFQVSEECMLIRLERDGLILPLVPE